MPFALGQSPVIGTIRVLPAAGPCSPLCEGDDSTLELWLERFAECDSVESSPAEMRLVASTRLSRLALCERATGVRANLAQLLADLQEEYDQLCKPDC
jgi:hypothetical protein